MAAEQASRWHQRAAGGPGASSACRLLGGGLLLPDMAGRASRTRRVVVRLRAVSNAALLLGSRVVAAHTPPIRSLGRLRGSDKP